MGLTRATSIGPDGFRTVYYRGGKGRLLVFLHGGGVHAGCYSELLQLLAERYDVVAPNLAGHGGSSPAGAAWGWADYAGRISSLLRHLDVNGYTVVGHSFGGGVAAHLAATDPAAERLALVDCAGTPMDWSLGSTLRLMVGQRIANSFRYRKLGVTLRLVGSFVGNLLRSGTQARTQLNAMRRLLTAFDDVFGSIRIPTLILWGKGDQVFPLASAEQIESQMKDAQLQIIDGDHEWCLFQAKLAAEKISTWVG